MNRIVFSVGLIGATIGLSACGSNNNNGDNNPLLSEEEAANQVFATAEDGTPIANLLEALEGGPVYARQVTSAGIDDNFGGETDPLYTLNRNDFSVQTLNAGERSITFSINGEEVVVTQADEQIIEGEAAFWVVEVIDADAPENSYYFDIFPVRNNIDGVYDETSERYLQAFGYFYDGSFADNVNTRGYAVVGAETRDGALDDRGDAVATYSGQARFNIRTQGLDGNEYDGRARANIEMIANFGANTISGTGDVFQYEDRAAIGGPIDPNGGIIFEETSIQGNAFSGDLNPDEALVGSEPLLADVIGASTYSGAFFGPTGEAVGGVASGSAIVGEGEGTEVLMYGTFEAQEVAD